MKKFIIILIFILLLLPTKSKEKIINLFNEELDAYGIAGLMCIIKDNETNPEPKPEPEPKEKCECDNGKISYDGGTSFTDCMCKNGNSNCGCKYSNSTESLSQEPILNCVCENCDEKCQCEDNNCECKNGICDCKNIDDIKEVTIESKPKYPRVVLVTQKRNCVYCRQVDTDIVSVLKNEAHQKSGWVVGSTEDCNLQILDLDEPSSIDEINRLNLEFTGVPSFFKISSGNTIESKTVGKMSYEEFLDFSGSQRSIVKKVNYNRPSPRRWRLWPF